MQLDRLIWQKTKFESLFTLKAFLNSTSFFLTWKSFTTGHPTNKSSFVEFNASNKSDCLSASSTELPWWPVLSLTTWRTWALHYAQPRFGLYWFSSDIGLILFPPLGNHLVWWLLQQGAQKCDRLTFFHAEIDQSEVESSFQLASDWIKSARKNVNKSKWSHFWAFCCKG